LAISRLFHGKNQIGIASYILKKQHRIDFPQRNLKYNRQCLTLSGYDNQPVSHGGDPIIGFGFVECCTTSKRIRNASGCPVGEIGGSRRAVAAFLEKR
jgi:hypothetical protein